MRISLARGYGAARIVALWARGGRSPRAHKKGKGNSLALPSFLGYTPLGFETRNPLPQEREMPNDLRTEILSFESALRILSAVQCPEGWEVTVEYADWDAGYEGGEIRELWTMDGRGRWECEGEVL